MRDLLFLDRYPAADVSLPFCPACATDIANSESEAEVITAIAALRPCSTF